MTTQLPRGATPPLRSDIAAAEPYRPEGGTEIFVPTGEFPSPNQVLADAQRYRGAGSIPESYIAWPTKIDFWGSETGSNSIWAEEAFAKACVEPKVFIPTEVVLSASRECGSSNFAAFMQARGFQMDHKAFLDGPFSLINWMNAAALNGAIANIGPVKIGVALGGLNSGPPGRVTPGASGWTIYGLPQGQPGGDCASLFGYGPLAALVDLFQRHGVHVNLPSGAPTGLSYAMFTSGSIGIIDRQSLVNITGEAWVRSPTTIVKTVSR
jgi:hypothetical protein